jgi:hypothetical protein
MTRTLGTSVAAAVLGLMLLPMSAAAQSAISGLVRDASGGVLPGVSVEAASPVLIERVRTVVTDDQGRYTIADLRPGLYKVTFALAGFTTLIRDGLELPSDFTASVNVEMKVGALAETVTVSGSAPLVDVQSSQQSVNLKREVLDALPTARTYAAEGSLAVGVRVNAPNVGGARIAAQQRMMVHGANAADNTISVDGMPMMSFYSNGETQPNHNDSMTQEVTVQTSSPSAEVSGGGLFMNLIPKEGGNAVSGSSFLGYTGRSFQGSNLTPALKAQGLASGDAVDHIYDVNADLGGPIRRNRLWFYGSFRDVGNGNIVANSFYPDGTPGIYDQAVQNYTVRLTWQAAQRHKVTAYMDRVFKHVGHAFSSGTDVLTAAQLWPTPLYYTGAIKWSSTLTDRLLLEGGVGASVNNISMIYQPGVAKTPFTPEWYATASRQDITLQTRTTAATPENYAYPPVYQLSGSASYVTGSHTFKTGAQWRFGPYRTSADANADLTERFRNGVPDSVIVYNTPVRSTERINADLGVFAQDSWKYRRLTINPGIRFEYFNAEIQTMAVEPGRFVGFRSYPAQTNLPNWFNVAPRFGLVYDLTGDAKTALRFGANKYDVTYSTAATAPYDPLVLQSDIRNWSDCDYIPGTSKCSGKVLPTNGDGIVQDNEIGPVVTPFGVNRVADPNRKRDYNIQYNVGIDRQLFAGVSVSAAWYKRSWYDLPITINKLVDPVADYTAFQTTNPLTGQQITLYNLNPAKAGQALFFDTTSTDHSKTRKDYTGIEVTVSARLPRGGNLFAGWAADRTIRVNCEAPFAPVGVLTSDTSAVRIPDPNALLNCDQSLFHIPLRSDLKFVGTYPLALGFSVGAVLQSYAGAEVPVSWSVPASVFPNGSRTQAVTVVISNPGSRYLDRWNQLDFSLKRSFHVQRVHVDASLDMFNALNSSVVLTQNQNFGSSLGAPTSILQPRLFRISSTLKF